MNHYAWVSIAHTPQGIYKLEVMVLICGFSESSGLLIRISSPQESYQKLSDFKGVFQFE